MGQALCMTCWKGTPVGASSVHGSRACTTGRALWAGTLVTLHSSSMWNVGVVEGRPLGGCRCCRVPSRYPRGIQTAGILPQVVLMEAVARQGPQKLCQAY